MNDSHKSYSLSLAAAHAEIERLTERGSRLEAQIERQRDTILAFRGGATSAIKDAVVAWRDVAAHAWAAFDRLEVVHREQVLDLERRLARTTLDLEAARADADEVELDPGWVYRCADGGLLYIGADGEQCGFLDARCPWNLGEDLRPAVGEEPVAYIGEGWTCPEDALEALNKTQGPFPSGLELDSISSGWPDRRI